jgi:hypothetical protein
MTNFVVTSTASGGTGSLRQAIISSNANPGSTITFDSSLANSTIALLAPLPVITADMTIDGSTLVNGNPVMQNITIDGVVRRACSCLGPFRPREFQLFQHFKREHDRQPGH